MRSGPGKNEQEPKKRKYSGQQQKEIDCDEPHPAPNEKTQPIQWTERPTGALVAVNSLWPFHPIHEIPERGFLDGALVGAGSLKPTKGT